MDAIQITRVVQGYIHQGVLGLQGLSLSFGTQCTAIAMVALIFASFHVEPSTWESQHLDTIVFEGDSLYQNIVHERYNDNFSTLLNHNDLPRRVSAFSNLYEQTLGVMIFGVVNGQSAVAGSGAYTISDGIRVTFGQSSLLVCTFGSSTVAVFMRGNQFYVFDSHARNQLGQVDPSGSSILIMFPNMDRLICYLSQTYAGMVFNISPVSIRKLAAETVLQHSSKKPLLSASSSSNKTVNDSNYTCQYESYTATACNTEQNNDSNYTRQYESYTATACNTEQNNDSNYTCQYESYTATACNTEQNNDSNYTRQYESYTAPACNTEQNGLTGRPDMSDSDNSHVNNKYRASSSKARRVKVRIHLDHTYPNIGGCKSQRRRKVSRSMLTSGLQIDTNISHHELLGPSVTEPVCFEVAAYCDVETTLSDNHSTELCSGSLHSSAQRTQQRYEQYIQEIPRCYCCCCDRFLFQDQVHHFGRNVNNRVTLALAFDSTTDLCVTCCRYIRNGKVPILCSQLNALLIDNLPAEITCLSGLEKKVLALIQVCMTVVLLPGGQYAERGLIVDLPRDVSPVIDKLSGLDDLCLIRFEAGSAVGSSCNFLVNPIKVIHAFNWLKANNMHYRDISVTSLPNFETGGHFTTSMSPDDRATIQQNVSSLEQISFAPVDFSAEFSDANNVTSTAGRQTVTIPRNTNSPVSVYEIPFGEEKAFPWLFPLGQFGFNHERDQKIKPSMYFRYRLFNRLAFWRKDITYLLHAAASYDKLCLKQDIAVCMKMFKHSRNDGSFTATTAQDVRSRSTNPDIIQNSFMFMKHIRGTVAYFRNALYDLLAMFRCLGPPTLFVTLSADDLHWPELGMSLENLSYEEALNKSSFYTSMRSDPLMTAIHFDRRFTALMKFVINGPAKPLGHVRDYFARVEFQNRGSPHYHIFFWVDNVPNEVNNATRNVIIKYLEQTVHCHVPPEDGDLAFRRLVLKLQTHAHSSYCMRSARPPCRFGFPKRECNKTRILQRLAAVKNRGQFYEPFRPKDSAYINAYNPSILKHWRANMDIQMINDADGAAYYVCHYLCKSEPDELRCALGNLINTVFRQNPTMSAFQRLWNIGLCVLKHRRVSAQEAAFRLSNLRLLQSSRSVVYLNTRPKEKRFRMVKPLNEIVHKDDDDTDIFLSNIFDYYCARPSQMEMVSLLYFASWYIKCPPASGQRLKLERIYISAFNIWMRKKMSFSVVRFPCFSVSSDDYYFTLLMLLLPFRSESDLVGEYACAKDAFIAKHALLDHSMHLHNHFLVQVENGIRRIRLAEAELQELPVSPPAEIDIGCSLPASSRPLSIQDIDNEPDLFHYHQLVACNISADDFHRSMLTLTNCQKYAINTVKKHFSSSVCNPLRLFITGGGGVGKSYLLKMIVSYLQLFTSQMTAVSPVKCCCPTGTAARQINGQTIHSLLAIPVDKYLNYAGLTSLQLRSLQTRFAGVHSLVIDEISMVSDRLLTFISRRLGEIAGNNSPFGGFNVILFGDFFQIRPVCGQYAFQNRVLWDLFEPVFLRENVRQSSDLTYVQLLKRARVGMLSPQDISLLKCRLATCPPSGGLCIFPTRTAAKEQNCRCQQHLDSQLYTTVAQHYFSSDDSDAGATCPDEYIPTDDRDAGNLPNHFEFSLGSRVMLLRNLDVSRSLVNGAMGSVCAVDTMSNGSLITISVLFDQLVSASAPQSDAGIPVEISMLEHKFTYGGRSVVRKAFPLMLCWACTIHKVQGMTTSECWVDIGSSVFQPGMAYVALSRVTSLQGLHLIRFNPDVVLADDIVLEEYERLREKSSQ